MESLFINSTNQTPEINFNPESGTFYIEGKSLPDNPIDFYQPVFDWANKYFYSDEVPLALTLNFKLEYYNTASSKQIAKLFKLLEQSPASENITIKWFYFEEDTDMLEAGERYEMLIKLDFEFDTFDE
ncbi:MAG: DUF1987 domain-containing protein [Bacteroidales bacterium]|nr:DUF1987 domain-containing protein [Bacteroidales bacterium]MBN2756153.1 DUF1987 domain-containing protein [Bacteroidales bacterium]